MKIIKSKKGISLILLVISTIVIGLSYGVFITSTESYDATSLMISELLYGINIVEDGNTGSTINSNVVTVPSGQKAFFYVSITSVNKIDSKYTLAYKTNSQVVVKYTDKTPWLSSGYIEGYDDSAYSKRIRIVVDNSTNSVDATVNFRVYGGYTFNSYASISLKDGYYTVGGPYTEAVAIASERLVDIIESETDCLTSETKSCKYGGGSIANYLQYPENEDVTKNIWRITGTYKIGDKTVSKIVSDLKGTTTVSNISNDLLNFYNSLDNIDNVVFKTNAFNCNSSGCMNSSFENIALITTFEYNEIGGINSYLANNNNYFAINGNDINNITSKGIETTSSQTSSGLRPTIYLKTDIQVTGSGTSNDPYRINQRSDINLVAYTLNNEPTDKTFQFLLANNIVDKITCEKGSTASWDSINKSITLTNVVVPDYCTINFKDGYYVKANVTNGTASPGGNVSVGTNGSVSITVTPDNGYDINNVLITGSGCPSTLTDGKLVVSNVNSNITCEVKFVKTLASEILAKNPNSTERTDFSTIETTTKLWKTTDYDASGNFTGTSYYYTGNPDNWVEFAGKLWRIIRINGDGSVRLLYAGTGGEDGFIGHAQDYNSPDDDPMYSGWKYGTSGSPELNRTNENKSLAYQTVENWYISNILNTGLEKFISKSAVYCNDRNIGSGSYNINTSDFSYAAYTRLVTNKIPTLACGNSSDRFKEGFGLMTADEVVFAGGLYQTNNENSYLHLNISNGSSIGSNNFWWLMSPYQKYSWGDTLSFIVYGNYNGFPGPYSLSGAFNDGTGGQGVVRPVISLNSYTVFSEGDGTSSNPYKIITN